MRPLDIDYQCDFYHEIFKFMKKHPHLIQQADELAQIAAQLSSETMIAVDTEFIRESTFFPGIQLLQVATDTESWLFDAYFFKQKDPAGIRPLLDIFENPNILKIFHAAQGDQECLYTNFQAIASPSLDTAVAASLCGYGDSIGLASLLQKTLAVHLNKGHARTDWSLRPLPEQLLDYAHADVVYLVKLASCLLNELDQLGRKLWALRLSGLSENPRLYQMDVEGITQRLLASKKHKEQLYPVLFELVHWREHRVRALDVPRKWIAEDRVLLDLAESRPQTLRHLEAFRGLKKGELKKSGEHILQAIQKGLQSSLPVELSRSQVTSPTPEESKMMDLLRYYMGFLAEKHQIAAKHLFQAPSLLSLIRSDIQKEEELVELGILTADAARLVGKELMAMLRGEVALGIGGRVVRVMYRDEFDGLT
jgi:ribonuclease D